jgi:Threonine synthase
VIALSECRLTCPRCGYEAQEGELRCPRCGSFLAYACHRLRWTVRRDVPSMWRYAGMLAFRPVRLATAGEGYTPVVRLGPVLAKLETRNPTGSYADRASSALVSGLVRDVYRVSYSIDFGPSMAFYAGLVGAHTVVYARPEELDPFDTVNLARLGASFDFTGRPELTYENQYTIEGLKTISYEIVEQMPRADRVFVPASTGLLAFAMRKGFREAAESAGASEPELVAVSVRGSAEPPTLDLLRDIKRVYVGAEEVTKAMVSLARRGIYARPLAAAAYSVAEAEEGIVVITGGLRRPGLSRRGSELRQKVIEVLARLGRDVTAYEVWEQLMGYTLRGVYKALEALEEEGVVCVNALLRGRRKVRTYRLCNIGKT